MIRRYFLLFISHMLLAYCAVAQYTGSSFTLSQPINSDGENTYTASNYVLLTPGFSVKASDEKSFTANIGGILTIPTGETFGGSDENNDGGVVGEIPLQFYVNEAGAAICNVAFDLPTGLNGLTPELGLNYNSQRLGEGIMGEGWGIQGVSSISKAPWNYYYNEGSSSIQFSFDDQLMLDGQYLIKSGNEYRTERESFDKIVPVDAANMNNGFKVFKTNGLVYYYGTGSNNYGNTLDPRLCLQNGKPIAWYLEKIEDQNGNTIEYTYLKDAINDGTIQLLYVYYGGNPSQNIPHKYRIQFNYLNHNGGSGWKKYFTSASTTSTINYTFDAKELNTVVLRYSESGEPFSIGTEMWTYTLSYPLSSENRKRQLEKIYFTHSGQKYNPLKFEWHGDGNEHPLDTSVLRTTTIQYDIPASQDENQIQVIPFRHKGPYPGAHLDHVMCYYVGRGSLNVFQWYWNASSLDPNALGKMNAFVLENLYLRSYTVDGYILGFKIWDIDNDGDDELVYIKGNSSGYAIHKVELDGIEDSVIATIGHISPDWFMFGDFDGNGYLDLAYRTSGESNVGWMMSEADSLFKKVYSSSGNFALLGIIKSYYTGRFSGAQKDELIFYVEEQGVPKVYYVGLKPTTSGHVIPERFEITGDARTMLISAVPNKSCFTGDFNNDGKTDFLSVEGTTITFYLSAGEGLFIKETIANQPLAGLSSDEEPIRFFITDANGDGYDDFIVICRVTVYDPSHYDYEQHYYRYDFLLSPLSGKFRFINQGDYVEIKPYSENVIHTQLLERRLHLLRGNFIGSSSNHLLVVYFNASKSTVYSQLTGIDPQYGHVIKKITGSMGDVTTIEYVPLSARVSVEHPIGKPPLAYYRGNEYIVTKFTQNNNLSRSFTYDQRYYFHKLGKGFLGFKSVTETDDRTGTVTTKNFTLNDTYYFMYPATTLVKQNNTNGKTISETTYTFSTKPIGETNEKRYYLCLDQDKTVEYDVLGNLRKTTTTKYQDHDEFYNPKTITFTVADESNRSFTKTSYVTYKNITTQGKYIIGLKETLHESFAAGVEIKTEFMYYANGMLKTKKTFYDKPNLITETYDYDAVGNITSIVQSAVGSPDRTNSFLYTDDKRFKKSSTNALGQTEHFQYYPATGLMAQSTDYNGRTTYYYYDAMGRLGKTAFPDGRFSLTARFWKGNEEHAPDNTLHYIWSQTSGESPTWTYYDKHGRELRNLYQNVTTSLYVAVDKTYGGGFKFDLIQDESLPYIISTGGGGGGETKGDPSTIYWKNHQYNNLRQLTTLSYPDTSQQKYDYDKNTVTFTDRDSIVYVKTYHGNGLIRELTSNGTKIEFLYTDDCLPAGTKHNSNNQLSESITYDNYRRPYQQKEMNRGTTTFLYNGWGELRLKQEPAGQTTYLYDALGRMTEKTAPDHIITWKYDDGYQAKGFITEETFKATKESHQVTKKYEYDYRTKLKKETQTISSEDTWAFEYNYDAIGQVKKTRYPSGFELYLTWKYGWLTEMKDKDDKSLWRAGSINAFGQYKTENLGIASKNISITYTYLDYNARLEEVMLRATNAVQVRQSYRWLTTGNLYSRKNELLGHVERFDYDDFNRLTTVTLNNTQTLSTTYNPLGNPDNRTGFGDIACLNANLPHAVTLTSAVPDAYQGMNQTAIYNSLNKVKSMNETDYQTGKQNHAYQAWYGASEELVRQRITSSSTITTRRIFGPYETETGMTAKNYVYLPDGSLVGWAAGNNFYYTLRDHLGSIIAIVDQDGNVQQQLSYDAWGRRRDPTTWNYNANLPTPLTSKGFTGHDHLDNFKLINMGGRMYDPVIGRFLNPDIIVQFPENPQSYNRYSYALNNPLKFTDPSGWSLKMLDDEWEIDKMGNIKWIQENKENDIFYSVDENGDRMQNVVFNYGTIEKAYSQNYETEEGWKSYDVLRVRGDDNGTKLFEFMSNHVTGSETSVEISQAMTGIAGDKGLNFITTGHLKAQEIGMIYLLDRQLLNGYTIRELNHSHPYTPDPSKSDIIFSSQIRDIMRYKNVPAPAFNIYYVPGKQKIPFDK